MPNRVAPARAAHNGPVPGGPRRVDNGSAMPVNRRFVLAAKPSGLPKTSDFRIVEAALPELKDGEVLFRTEYLSVDPYMRSRIAGVKTYADPVLVGEPMVGSAVGRVVASRNSRFAEGDWAAGFWGWQEYAVSDGRSVNRVDPLLAPPSASLGILGAPGMTAYFGLLELCNPKPGETVLISGAAGAVGSAAGQIARIQGCHVVGIAGTDDKIRYITGELGFDGGFNYKTSPDFGRSLRDLCPQGIDCHFDNVGGAISDAAFLQMNTFGRVAVCGQISQYNLDSPPPGPRLLGQILIRQLRVEGFIITRFANRFSEGVRQMAQWLREGKLRYCEEIVEGFENTPQAFIDMLQGANTGKMLVKCV